MEQKFNGLVLELNASLSSSMKKIAADTFKDSITTYKTQVSSLDDRRNFLETRSLQKDLIIYGLKSSEIETGNSRMDKDSSSTQSLSLTEFVRDHIKDINFAYKMKKRYDNNSHPPILVNFVSTNK